MRSKTELDSRRLQAGRSPEKIVFGDLEKLATGRRENDTPDVRITGPGAGNGTIEDQLGSERWLGRPGA